MKVFRLNLPASANIEETRQVAALIMRTNPEMIPVRFLMPKNFEPDANSCLEEVKTPQAEALKEKPAKGRRGYPSVKVEITGTLAEKLRAYSGTDTFMISVIDSWKKWGKLSPGQIFWIEKKLNA